MKNYSKTQKNLAKGVVDDTNEIPEEPDEHIRMEMKPSYTEQVKLYDWFNRYKKCMEDIFKKRKMLLEQKYSICKKWLDKAQENIERAKQTRKRLMNEYHSSEEFLRTQKECEVFTKQYDSLSHEEHKLKELCL